MGKNALEAGRTADMRPEGNVDYRIKLLYAIAACMVVLAHCRGGGIVLLFDWFPYGGLHVALFMFCSGYLYKDSSEKNAGHYILKKLKRLILPLYIYNLVYGLIVQLLHLFGFQMGGGFTLYNLLVAPLNDGHQFILNLGGWFVIPLFMVQVCTVLFRKFLRFCFKRTPEWFCALICIVLGIIGNQLAILGHNQGWELMLVRMLHLLPYFGIGVFYKHILEPVARKIPNWIVFATVLAVKLIIVLNLGRMPDYTASWCSDFIEGPVMPLITVTVGIIFYMRVAVILEPIASKSRMVNLIADSTYSIMMNHLLGILMVKSLFACISKFTPLFADFDWLSFKTDIWWYYVPFGISYMLILYVIGGLAFPVLVQKLITYVSKHISKVTGRLRQNRKLLQ